MDSYQPIYDAVRSKIGNGNIGDAVESAIRDANISHYVSVAFQSISYAAAKMESPSVLYRPVLYRPVLYRPVLYRPALSMDGNKWCALYGEDLQAGVAGFGDSPYDAMVDFDRAWYSKVSL